MSHYTVLVIGENPEEMLEPYNEHTQVPEYITSEVTDEEKMRFLEFYKDKENTKNLKKGQSHKDIRVFIDEFPKYYQKYGNDWNGNRWRPDSNGVWQEYSTYNPKSKWDWYALGGRWKGMLKLKAGAEGTQGEPGAFGNSSPEGWVDQAYKGDIDWQGMRMIEKIKAIERYDKFEEETEKPPTADFVSQKYKWWEDDAYPNEKHPSSPKKDYDTFEDMLMKTWREKCASTTGIISIFHSGNIPSREEYVAKMQDFSTYAVLDEKGWHESGRMGWWGISHASDEEQKKFQEGFFEKWIEPLDDDVLISVYDCHI